MKKALLFAYLSNAFFLNSFVLFALPAPKATNLTLELRGGMYNIAYKWGKVALEATGRDTERFNPRPTVTSRYLGLVFTAVFDAWSRYDEKAIPVYLNDVKRQQKNKRTLANKERAVSYAAYGALKRYFFADSVYGCISNCRLGLVA